MNLNLATIMVLLPAPFAIAQSDVSSSPFSREEAHDRSSAQVVARDYDEEFGPFTRQEAHALRSVWPTIREAANFYDINWRSVGLARAPGDRRARRFMADDWGSLRRAAQFDDINWRAEYRRR